MRPKELCDDGFKIEERRNINTLALNSLRVAVKSYFSTYQAISLNAIDIFNDNCEDGRRLYNKSYMEMYSETIVHFQHFFELVLKDILREQNELLALRVEDKPELFIELALGNDIDSQIIEKQKTVEFGTAFERVKALIKKDEYSQYSFLGERDNSEALVQLNIMRNKIWHRGSYVLRYTTLDLYIGRYVLPIVRGLMKLDEYKGLSNLWKGSNNRLGIDPIEEIIGEIMKPSPSFDKIAFLKELGRASYNNELSKSFGIFNDEIENRAKSIAEKEIENIYTQGAIINNCPSCGVTSLVGYHDTEIEYEDDEPIAGWEFIYQVKCHCCNFELRNLGMKNLKDYGFKDEPDYWLAREL